MGWVESEAALLAADLQGSGNNNPLENVGMLWQPGKGLWHLLNTLVFIPTDCSKSKHYFMEKEWLCSKAGANRHHPGEFLYKWPRPNTWAKLQRSFSTDCSSLTAGGNEVACELCRSRGWRRLVKPWLLSAFGCPALAVWAVNTHWWLHGSEQLSPDFNCNGQWQESWKLPGTPVSSEKHTQGVSVSSQGEGLCLSKEDSLDESVVPCDRTQGSLQCTEVYDVFCRHHLLVWIHTWPEVLTEPAVRPVGVVAQDLKQTLVRAAQPTQSSQCCSLKQVQKRTWL